MAKILRAGHAPGHIREALADVIESRDEVTLSHPIETEDKPRTLKWLTGQLWNCTDILPGLDCDLLEIPTGSTYAQAARHLRKTLLD